MPAEPVLTATISALDPASLALLHQGLDVRPALLELRLLALAALLATSQSLTTAKHAPSLDVRLAVLPSAPAVPARMATTELLPALPAVLTAPLAHLAPLALAKQDMRTEAREPAPLHVQLTARPAQAHQCVQAATMGISYLTMLVLLLSV